MSQRILRTVQKGVKFTRGAVAFSFSEETFSCFSSELLLVVLTVVKLNTQPMTTQDSRGHSVQEELIKKTAAGQSSSCFICRYWCSKVIEQKFRWKKPLILSYSIMRSSGNCVIALIASQSLIQTRSMWKVRTLWSCSCGFARGLSCSLAPAKFMVAISLRATFENQNYFLNFHITPTQRRLCSHCCYWKGSAVIAVLLAWFA